MAGGAQGNQQQQTPMTQALQNFPIAPNSGAQAYAAGSQPTAQGVSQLQQMLQRMGSMQGGGQSPAMRVANTGMQMARIGAPPQMMPPQMPHPMMGGAPPPMQGAMPPQMMTGSMGMPQVGMGGPQGGLPWQAILRGMR